MSRLRLATGSSLQTVRLVELFGDGQPAGHATSGSHPANCQCNHSLRTLHTVRSVTSVLRLPYQRGRSFDCSVLYKPIAERIRTFRSSSSLRTTKNLAPHATFRVWGVGWRYLTALVGCLLYTSPSPRDS